MWIMLSASFLSICSKYCQPHELMVRARKAGHIENVFSKAKVKFDPNYDYWYTAIVPREEVALVIAERVRSIKPGSIKDAVSDPALKAAYYEVWSVMAELQADDDGGPSRLRPPTSPTSHP